MKQIQKIKYIKELYQLREDLHEVGIMQPVKEMIKEGLIGNDTNNHNFISGRIVNLDFLTKLRKLKQ